MENPNYYAIIPANVRYDKRLKPMEKLMYGEIVALTNKNGYCHAKNRYFSNLYDVSTRSVCEWISKLSEYGYIRIDIEKNEKNEVIDRKIYINDTRAENFATPHEENFYTPSEENFYTPHEENFYTLTKKTSCMNNINNNNINNKNKKENIKEKEKDSSCGAEAPLSNTEDVGRYSDANASSSGANAPKPPKDENTTKELNEKLIHNFNILWEIYPRKDGKNEAFKHYKAWLKGKEYAGEEKKLTNEQMWYSIKKYNEEKANTEKRFLKMGSTFFNQTIYEYAPSLEEIEKIENDSG